jgi:hypothetical protein
MDDLATAVEDYSPRIIGGTDLALPASWSVTTSEPGVRVVVAIRVDEDGRLHVRAVTVEGDDVGSADLRRVEVPRLVDEGMRRVAMRVLPTASGSPVVTPASDEDPVDLAQVLALALEPEPTGGRRVPVTPERLRKVAERYRAATLAGVPSSEAVASALKLSRSQAAALVSRARREVDPETGETYLGGARRGKGGER